MPVIPVRCACGVCPEEWAMIELQGSLEIQQSALHRKLETLTIGALCTRPGDKFSFNVGYHELEGSKVSLKKPLVVLKKNKLSDDSTEIDSSDLSKGSPKVGLEVVGIIRHKLLFKNRPKALISSESSFCRVSLAERMFILVMWMLAITLSLGAAVPCHYFKTHAISNSTGKP